MMAGRRWWWCTVPFPALLRCAPRSLSTHARNYFVEGKEETIHWRMEDQEREGRGVEAVGADRGRGIDPHPAYPCHSGERGWRELSTDPFLSLSLLLAGCEEVKTTPHSSFEDRGSVE